MNRIFYQAVVIGGGSGGYAAAAKLADYGLNTVLIENAEELGGLCILRGCMPSKAMIESANLLRRMRRSTEFGIHTDGLRVSMDEVQDRKQRLITEFAEYRVRQLEDGKFDLVRGEAKFIGEREIEVQDGENSRVIEFEYAVNQGESVAKHIAILSGCLEGEIEGYLDSKFELFGIFTHPECARAGMTKEQISDGGYEVKSARYHFADLGKAEILGETAGFVKITSEKKTGRILSAVAIGPHVIDLIHELQVAIHAGLSVTDIAKIPHYHPTLAEIWTYPAEELGR